MTSAVDGLKQRFMAMSQPDADGVYRNGAAKRKARTDLAMGNLTQLWNEACEAVSFDVPATGIGLGAVGSLARGQVGPSSDLDLVVIYEPHALTDQQLNELANKLWYPIWDSGLDLDQSVRTVAQCEAVAAAEYGLPIAPGTLRNLKKCPIGDRNWTDESRELFIRLLASGPALLNVWEDIDFIDVPGKLIPEWLGVRNRPSASAAHRYTIDRHMVEVVTRLGRETPSGGRYDDRHYEALLLAGILHDIGKRPGVANHAAEGARHATVVVERMGFDRDIVRWVTLLVREHLTLSEFATGRNPNDPNVGDDLAGRLDHNPVLLDMLFDLTRADGSSLGATSGETISKQYGWSKWRETLVRTMYNATRYHM